jgi:hypothetical protein
VAAILCQEHDAVGNAWHDLQARGISLGWNIQGASSFCGDGGRGRASSCIAAQSYLGLAKVNGVEIDTSPIGSDGRLAVAWIDSIVR